MPKKANSTQATTKQVIEERKIEIPKMDKTEIVKWYKTIKPIVIKGGKPNFLRELSDEELTGISYTWLKSKEDYGEKVDFSQMSILADVKMLHGWGYYGYFKPSVGEVIRQIPKELLDKVVAFKIVYSPVGSSDFEIFKPEFNAGYHVSVVRLYEVSNESKMKLKQFLKFPNENGDLPIGMTEDEFERLKEQLKIRG